MSDVGAILREAREAQGLSLAHVRDDLRISERYLQAIEEDAYDLLPTDVHVRGYLRNYARYLGLDPEPLVESLLANQRGRRRQLARGQRGTGQDAGDLHYTGTDDMRPVRNQRGTFFNPTSLDLNPQSRSNLGSGILRMLLGLVILGVIGVFAWRIVGDNRQLDLGALGSDLAAIVQREDGAAADDASVSAESSSNGVAAETISTDPIVPTSRNNPDESSEVTAPSTFDLLPDELEEINIKVEVLTDNTWFELIVDDERVLDGLHAAGTEYEFSAARNASINTGSGADLFVTINGYELGPLGNRQEVVQKTWTTTQ